MSAAPVGGNFDLIDHFGERASPARFAGRHLLVFFGFTHCKVICPETLSKLSSALEMAGVAAADVQPLYITVDPERDSPEQMRHFLENRFPRFLGLTGTREQIDRAKAIFKVFTRKIVDASGSGDYDVPHSAYAFLMAPGNEECVAYFPRIATAQDVAAGLARVRLDASTATGPDRRAATMP